MKAQTATGLGPVDEIPVQKLLEGLAKLYPLVLVLDAEGTVVWLSNEMSTLCSEALNMIGKDARAALSDSPEFRREFMIRSKLRNDGFLSNLRINVRKTDGDDLPIELSILRRRSLRKRPKTDRGASRRYTGRGAGGERTRLHHACERNGRITRRAGARHTDRSTGRIAAASFRRDRTTRQVAVTRRWTAQPRPDIAPRRRPPRSRHCIGARACER